jgi:hypothetical protein
MQAAIALIFANGATSVREILTAGRSGIIPLKPLNTG